MPYEAKKPQKKVEAEQLYDMIIRGMPKTEMAPELGMSVPTLNARIADIQSKQGVILQYRAIQNLQLTELQGRCLEAITPDKIEEAPLRDLIFAYKVLKDKELVVTGKPTELKGMMHYLIELEKQDDALATEVSVEDADYEEVSGDMPKL